MPIVGACRCSDHNRSTNALAHADGYSKRLLEERIRLGERHDEDERASIVWHALLVPRIGTSIKVIERGDRPDIGPIRVRTALTQTCRCRTVCSNSLAL